ncbi:MAG: hypothetical protein WC322_00105 [Candidatus Paceibacterota bacterium]|jgi:hypothetical protein
MAKVNAGTVPGPKKKAPGKAVPDWERIELDYRAGVKTLRQIADEREAIFSHEKAKHGTEYDLVRQFLESHHAGLFDEMLPCESAADTVVTEYAFRHGRADIILFHTDGTATIIEAKDGQRGYTNVVAGIGQCSLYAAQLAAKPGVVRAVRRALMWTSVGNVDGDAKIEEACEIAGVIPLPYPSMRMLMATRMASERVIARAKGASEVDHGCA